MSTERPYPHHERDLPVQQPAMDRREVFCRTYVQDLNATRAYRLAFPNEKREDVSTWSCAHALMQEPWVQNRIKELLRERYALIDLKTEQIIRQLVNIAFLDKGDLLADDGTFLPIGEMPEYVRRAIDSIEVEERVSLERTKVIDNDTGELKERVEPVRVKVTKVKLASRISALQMLAKHQGLLDDKVKLAVETVRWTEWTRRRWLRAWPAFSKQRGCGGSPPRTERTSYERRPTLARPEGTAAQGRAIFPVVGATRRAQSTIFSVEPYRALVERWAAEGPGKRRTFWWHFLRPVHPATRTRSLRQTLWGVSGDA